MSHQATGGVLLLVLKEPNQIDSLIFTLEVGRNIFLTFASITVSSPKQGIGFYGFTSQTCFYVCFRDRDEHSGQWTAAIWNKNVIRHISSNIRNYYEIWHREVYCPNKFHCGSSYPVILFNKILYIRLNPRPCIKVKASFCVLKR